MKKIYLTKLLLIGLFLIFIWLPLILLLIQPKLSVSNLENRQLAEYPVFSINDLDLSIGSFERFFNDHFGFRQSLISLNNYLSIAVFNQSSNPIVVLGRDNWLYLSEGIKGVFDRPPYPVGSINDLDKLAENYQVLQKNGIQFISLVVPDKHSIYPEYLPDYFPSNYRPNPRVKQRLDYLQSRYSINEIDLFSIFAKEKKNKQLYYKMDSHWNSYGSFIAYEQIIMEIKKDYPDIVPLTINDFIIEESKRKNHTDLYYILSADIPFDEQEITFWMKDDAQRKLVNTPKLNKLIVYHDSFFEPTEKWSPIHLLKQHFHSVIGIKNIEKINPDFLVKQKPDVVVYEIVERNI